MPVREQRDDSEPIRVTGKPMKYQELMAIAEISTQDLSAALDRFARSAPPRYRNLLD